MRMSKAKVLIAGGSGLIGGRLTEFLLEAGYEPWWLSRSGTTRPGVKTAAWDPRAGTIEPGALQDAYAVINLAGEGIADGRWTDERKRRIVESRTGTTELLAQGIQTMPTPPQVFVGASAIGYYGNRGSQLLTEDSPRGDSGFLPDSVAQIEKAITTAVPDTIRRVIPRFGVVLSNQGGALPKFTGPIKLGVAAYMGSGHQYMSWIHIDDLCRFLVMAIRDAHFEGVYNLTAPEAVTGRDLASALRHTYNRYSVVMPVPAFALRTAFGEMADTILDSAKVLPERLINSRFSFQFPDIHSALKDLKESGH